MRRKKSAGVSHLRKKKKKMPQFQSLILLVLLVAMERWLTPATGDPLRIGVPVGSPCPKYVEVKCNQISNKCFGGFSIEVFELILNRIGYKEAYQFIPYNDSYDNLVQQVYSKVSANSPFTSSLQNQNLRSSILLLQIIIVI